YRLQNYWRSGWHLHETDQGFGHFHSETCRLVRRHVLGGLVDKHNIEVRTVTGLKASLASHGNHCYLSRSRTEVPFSHNMAMNKDKQSSYRSRLVETQFGE